ncbi:MAG: GspE/PulE family protein [Planctomycetota bacterium]|nr:GspE/PulE family protein [Planctomycetota bacterium]
MRDAGHFLIRALLAEKLISEADVQRASEVASAKGSDPVDGLVTIGVISSRRVAIERAKLCEYPFVDLTHYDIDFHNTRLMPRNVAEKLIVFPLFCFEGVATVAMLDPLNLQAIDQVRQVLKGEIDPVICDAEQLRALIARAYSLSAASTNTGAAGDEQSERTTGDEPIVAAVNQILASAVELGASDIHINPDEAELVLRYRVDGVLQTLQGPQKSAHAGIVQRLKVLAQLDLTQTRRPQDGKFRFHPRSGAPVDVRLSIVPTIHGENVVMRLLRSSRSIGAVRDLMMPDEMMHQYEGLIAKPNGMILVTGPTGSGKTTTLFAALSQLNSPTRNIITIEDPVEIRLPLVRQVQVNSEIGLTFANALRSILRQDPDVVLVGEIRDNETAKIAAQAALTGHLVMSTLHTNDAVGTIARLRDFDVPTFAITNALLAAIAQRLVRRVCDACAESEVPEPQLMMELGLTNAMTIGMRRGCGCVKCGQTGFRGRVGVYEMLRMTAEVQHAVEHNASRSDLMAAAQRDGFRPMWRDGVEKACRGITSLSEVARLRTVIDARLEAEEANARAAA